MADEPTPGTDGPEETDRTTKDVGLLLEFLGEHADSRLQAHFEDTRAELSAPIRKLAAPPCRTYRHFLSRFAAVETRRRSPGAAPEPAAAPASSTPEGDEELSDRAFLLFSRDFLAAVAAPATVDSIRVTRSYIAARRHSLLSRLMRRPHRLGGSSPAPGSDGECALSAKRLASRVVLIEWFAVGGTALTLIISAYALSGHRILDSQSQIFAEYAAIGRDKQALAQEMTEAKDLVSRAAMAALCDPRGLPPAATKDAVPTVRVDAQADKTSAADPPRRTITSLRECALYWRTKQNNENIAAVTLHMMSWSRVVINDLDIGEVFGVNPAVIRASAAEHTEFCSALGLPLDRDGGCGKALQDIVYHTREVADSLLGCIALYVLPTLYGGLGAMAATLRRLRRRVDQWLVTVTDRGQVQQDAILGVLCGAIIGLFFGYLGDANPETGLGLSALAFLAGYNAAGVFAFLDDLSNRVFQPAHSAQSDARPN